MPPKPASSATSSSAAAGTAAERRPLAEEILTAGQIRNKAPKQKSNKRKSRHEEESGNPYIDARASRKILNLGQDLADEEAAENRAAGLDAGEKDGKKTAAFEFDYSKFASRDDDDEDEDEELAQGADDWADEEEEVEAIWNSQNSVLRA
ncbi:snoRNA-binding rRNA-processing protein, partial [Ascosphaera pollenicola]